MQMPVAGSPDTMRLATPGAGARATVDFFAAEERASARAWRFFALFVLCVIVVVATIDVWVGFIASGIIVHDWPMSWQAALDAQPTWQRLLVVPLPMYAISSMVMLMIVATAAVQRMRQLHGPAALFAQGLGARAVERDHPWPQEAELVHAAEEMAVAAGLPPPSLHVLDGEAGINAFAIGSQRDDIAVVVTRGAVLGLARPQLQALVAFALARAGNGDVELNVRLIGWLAGLTAIAATGLKVMGLPWRGLAKFEDPTPSKNPAAAVLLTFGILFFLAGIVIVAIGYVGVVLARWMRTLGARQRVLLADATAIQLTRDQDVVLGLLRAVQTGTPGKLTGRYREEIGPLLFLPGVGWQLLATHPRVARRLAALSQA